jgi:hypothetical protein
MLILTFYLQARELDDRETRLKIITEEQDKIERLRHIKEDKISKDIESVKKQLSHERNLKLDAFNRVDDLQTHVRYILYLII